jgi:hypothetical protein
MVFNKGFLGPKLLSRLYQNLLLHANIAVAYQEAICASKDHFELKSLETKLCRTYSEFQDLQSNNI